jgi:hypothetical protein
MQTTLGSNEMDITLYGDSLKEWKEWASSLKQQERLLPLAILLSKVFVYGSMPLWVIALLIGIPFMFLDMLTFRLLSAPLRALLSLLLALVRSSSETWAKSPFARPFLILSMPIIVALAMILIYLIPHESDVRQTKNVLCELWPLSERRLQWIATRGNGKVVQ